MQKLNSSRWNFWAWYCFLWLILVASVPSLAAGLAVRKNLAAPDPAGRQICTLVNDAVALEIVLQASRLAGDQLTSSRAPELVINSDGGFALEVMWTGWRAPGRVHNADNPLRLTNAHFDLVDHRLLGLEELDQERSEEMPAASHDRAPGRHRNTSHVYHRGGFAQIVLRASRRLDRSVLFGLFGHDLAGFSSLPGFLRGFPLPAPALQL